ncbi:1,4-dihydroxy-2-naphthoate octaprenyltransferase [Robiginitalea sp. M366]|uniref:1,4-dihydroxy-2-naphthoate octaprenyltransferase n=1 Tax=Robiginitalea aestuariiviva TaxID=3036903 RepID=UPI00240D74C4|nr:1,4-dihydroxy-2-naphthoate octaprenyltransferase [Robiginitalea aestuariiviva]MDG1573075.1 1,4-dihydroxy-2-naphthoate octaprenyltransferase [Robiginitalea aestuariiviva]
MAALKTWLGAARLRTLPLSIAGILAGTAMARAQGLEDTLLFTLTLATTLAYQITSNFANDYGDGVKGTDNASRIGPARALQSGAISRAALKRGIWVMIAISAALTLATLLRAFGAGQLWYFLLFGLLGLCAIWASIRYTVGNTAYGYKGLGDLFVFLFFGLLSVQGCQFLYTQTLLAEAWLPAIAIGALSAAVLNLNNLRDLEPDRAAGKITLAVRLGPRWGRVYHWVLCLTGFTAMVAYVFIQPRPAMAALVLLPFLGLAWHLVCFVRAREARALDPELKKVALSTFALGLLLYLLNHYFL